LTPGAGLVLSAGWWLCAVGRPANQRPYNYAASNNGSGVLTASANGTLSLGGIS
jgi:hypothetical protein